MGSLRDVLSPFTAWKHVIEPPVTIKNPIGREAADRYSSPGKPRFVAGVLGPTNRTASISPDVTDPGKRNVRFDQLVAAYREAALSLAVAVVPLGVKTAKTILILLAGIALLQHLGFNVTGVIAGLGVGGIALALAAQKTIDNLFGGATLVTDQPVRVGDFCRFGDKVGTVEDIGAAALYLLSDAGSWVTGKVLEVDGGTVDSNWPFQMPSGLTGPKGV